MVPKRQRLRTTAEFQHLYKHGRTLRSPTVKVVWLPTLPPRRWAIVISTKVSKSAVARNRARRITRSVVEQWDQSQKREAAVQAIITIQKIPEHKSDLKNDVQQCLQRISTTLKNSPQRPSFNHGRLRH